MTELTPPGPPDPGQPQQPASLPSAPPLSHQENATAAQGTNRRMLVIGMVAGLVLFALALGLPISGGLDPDNYWALGVFLFVVMVAALVTIAAFVMVFIEKTRSLAIGLFISLGAGVLIDGGTCIALLASQNP